jgi:hypothetical protein
MTIAKTSGFRHALRKAKSEVKSYTKKTNSEKITVKSNALKYYGVDNISVPKSLLSKSFLSEYKVARKEYKSMSADDKAKVKEDVKNLTDGVSVRRSKKVAFGVGVALGGGVAIAVGICKLNPPVAGFGCLATGVGAAIVVSGLLYNIVKHEKIAKLIAIQNITKSAQNHEA